MPNELREGLKRYLNAAQRRIFAQARIGIAGAGGLGSNVAMILARSGIEKMTIIDYDSVEASNLNRQHYWPRHIGKNKVEALAENLLELNPRIDARLLVQRLAENNLPDCLKDCQIWVEALDNAESKAMFVRNALALSRKVVAASGICGIGGEPLRKKRLGNLLVVGDFHSDADNLPPMAPRVIQAAAMMADGVLEMLLENSKTQLNDLAGKNPNAQNQ